jgi:ligand-binding SRPBCC domain-containing protein
VAPRATLARVPTIVRSSCLAAPAARVWADATRLPAINAEMRPWLSMTAPAEARGRSIDDPALTLGVPLFRSWVLLLFVLPVERMDVTISALDPGRRFVEESRVLVLRRWRHERTVEPDGDDACVVTDTLTVEPHVSLLAPFVAWFVGAFFAHRHRRLRARFGGARPRP